MMPSNKLLVLLCIAVSLVQVLSRQIASESPECHTTPSKPGAVASEDISILKQDCGRRSFRWPLEGGPIINRVSGGYTALPNQFPSFVKLRVLRSNGNIGCGGTLISRQFVMTAAHCTNDSLEVFVQASVYGDQSKKGNSAKWIKAEKICDVNATGSDISLIRLPEPLLLSRSLHFACLPDEPLDFETAATAVGLGPTYKGTEGVEHPEKLQALPVIRTGCRKPNVGQLCTRPYKSDFLGDTCGGDSGGPIYVTVGTRQTVFAVTSSGPLDTCVQGTIGHASNGDVFEAREEIINTMQKCY